MSRVALATCERLDGDCLDDRPLIEALARRGVEAEFAVWDDEGVEWDGFDLIVVRSTWDYSRRRDEFLAWAEAIGPERLRNRPDVLRWNTDKRYLAELDGAGFPVPPTLLVAPGGALPELEAEVVVKPVVGAGARDTGRFGLDRTKEAYALMARIGRNGGIAMVQPYIEAIEHSGETALVMIAGRFSHALRKRALLEPDRVAPLAENGGPALAMLADDLIAPTEPSERELALAERVCGWLGHRFGRPPLYARVDLVPGLRDLPMLMELELTEPSLYLAHDGGAGAAERLAEAVLADLPVR